MNGNMESVKTKNVKVVTSRSWKSWRVNIFVFMCIGLLLFLGTCEGAQLMGKWSTATRKILAGSTVSSSNGANPAEVKGSMTIQAVLTTYNVSWEELSKQFNIPADTPSNSQLKTLEAVAPDFSVDKLRTWLTERAR
jgi:hypothetical protein